MGKTLKIGNAEVKIQSYDDKCIFMGKKDIHCLVYNKELREKEKNLTKEKRCQGFNKKCEFFAGSSPFVPAYDEHYLLPQKESEILAYALSDKDGKGDNVLIFGPPGCLSKDTILGIARGGKSGSRKYTIKEAYHRFHRIRTTSTKKWAKLWDPSYRTRILSLEKGLVTGYQEIEDIVYSGEKTTYTITVSSGKSLRTTKNHRFKVPKGTLGADNEGFKKLKDLKVGDRVILRNLKGKGTGKKRPPPEREVLINQVIYHPHVWHKIRKVQRFYYPDGKVKKEYHHYIISKAKACIEAKLNDITLEKFIEILRSKPKQAKKLKFLDPSLIIHHKDRNVWNNSFSNLKALTKKEHDKLHGKKESRKHLPYMRASSQTITSIKKFGKEETYDIIMKEPYKNFVAQDFIVHNSGKSSLVKQIASILNWGVEQFSCSEETTSAKIIGQWIVVGKSMQWIDGCITNAMKNGFILLEDEADFMRPELRGEVHGIMEEEGSVTLTSLHPKTGQPFREIITKHPSFRWISTANTIGYGDDLFVYHGTQYMNAASRDRYEIILQFDYRTPEEELEIVTTKTKIDPIVASKMIEIANICRSDVNEDMVFQFSLRRLLAWARYWNQTPPEVASTLAVLNYCNQADRHTVKSLIRTHLNIET